MAPVSFWNVCQGYKIASHLFSSTSEKFLTCHSILYNIFADGVFLQIFE